MYNQTKNDILIEKVKSPDEILKNLKNTNPDHKVAMLGGCFDLTHPGHLDLISRAKYFEVDGSFIDTVIIALNSDISVKILKGESRPILNQDDRAFFLASLSYVDYVTIFDAPVIDGVLKAIRPDYFIKSDQYSYESMTQNEKNIFKEYNITPLFLPFYNQYSTTHLINQVEANTKSIRCICEDRLNKQK
jgi:rfaE bifunctional protein nucleotidyltransferase chain/domain